MSRPASLLRLLYASVLVGVFFTGCDQPRQQQQSDLPRIASMVPAATDILLAIGAKEQLVAVSNYEPADSPVAGLPKVGDYTSVDVERLTAVRPTHIVVFVAPDKLPAGLAERTRRMGTTVMNIRTDTIRQIEQAILLLSEAAGQRDSASKLSAFRNELAAIPKLKRQVRVLLAMGEGGAVIGNGGFLHELLILVGAANAAGGIDSPYPTLDEEKLAALSPEVIIVLAPGVAAPQVADIKSKWKMRMNQGRSSASPVPQVIVLTDPRLLISGYCVTQTARQIADAIRQFE